MSVKAAAASLYAALVASAALSAFFWASNSAPLLASGDQVDLLIVLGRLAGIALALLVLAQLLLASRLPLLHRADLVPLRIHRVIGFSIPFVIVLHIFLLAVGYAQRDDAGTFSHLASIILNRGEILLAMIAVIIMLAVALISMRRMKSRLRYETWYTLHLPLYAAILLAFVHQVATGDFAYGTARIFWLALTAAAVGLFIGFRVVRPVRNMLRHRFRVSRIVQESPSTTSVYITGDDLASFSFEPGQYAHFTFLAPGMWAHHPFSFSHPNDGGELRITTKQLGDFTERLKGLPVGTRVVIDGPLGRFTRSHAKTGKFCFVAGGIGIAPVASIALSLPDPSAAVVFVSNRTRADEPLLDELERAGVPLFRYRSEEGDPLITGEEILRRCPDVRERDVYLCGPKPMEEAISRGLLALGVPPEQIHTEAFAY